MNRCIVIRTQFEAIHNWPECPIKEVEFLKHPHRHMFHVEMKWTVSHADREKEFIMMKRRVDQYINSVWTGRNIGRLSCENIADTLVGQFKDCIFISVFEDNENGVEVDYAQ
jgi:6-pyruvoyl-tetrahydropterin synthase